MYEQCVETWTDTLCQTNGEMFLPEKGNVKSIRSGTPAVAAAATKTQLDNDFVNCIWR